MLLPAFGRNFPNAAVGRDSGTTSSRAGAESTKGAALD